MLPFVLVSAVKESEVIVNVPLFVALRAIFTAPRLILVPAAITRFSYELPQTGVVAPS